MNNVVRWIPYIAVLITPPVAAQTRSAPPDARATVPPLAPLVTGARSELAAVVDRFATDRNALNRRYDASDSPAQRRRIARGQDRAAAIIYRPDGAGEQPAGFGHFRLPVRAGFEAKRSEVRAGRNRRPPCRTSLSKRSTRSP